MPSTAGLKFGDAVYNQMNPFKGPTPLPVQNGGSFRAAGGGGGGEGGTATPHRWAALLIAMVVLLVATSFAFDLGGLDVWHNSVGSAMPRIMMRGGPPPPPPEEHISRRQHVAEMKKLRNSLQRQLEGAIEKHRAKARKDKADADTELEQARRHSKEEDDSRNSLHRQFSQQLQEKEREAATLREENSRHKKRIATMSAALVKHGQEMLRATGAEEEDEAVKPPMPTKPKSKGSRKRRRKKATKRTTATPPAVPPPAVERTSIGDMSPSEFRKKVRDRLKRADDTRAALLQRVAQAKPKAKPSTRVESDYFDDS